MQLTQLLAVLGLQTDGTAPGTDGFLHRLEAQLTRLSPERIQYLAGFAGELARVADVDAGISAAEASVITTQLSEHGHLTAAEADIVLDLLRHDLEVLHDLPSHTLNRAVNGFASPAEKEILIDCMYAVAAADDLVSDVEEREIRRIADALLVSHSAVMDIRARYRDRIEALQAMKRGRD